MEVYKPVLPIESIVEILQSAQIGLTKAKKITPAPENLKILFILEFSLQFFHRLISELVKVLSLTFLVVSSFF